MDLPGKSKRAVANLVEIWTSPVPACEIQSLNHYRPQVHTAWHIAATYFFRSWRKEFHIVVNVSPTFQQVFFFNYQFSELHSQAKKHAKCGFVSPCLITILNQHLRNLNVQFHLLYLWTESEPKCKAWLISLENFFKMTNMKIASISWLQRKAGYLFYSVHTLKGWIIQMFDYKLPFGCSSCSVWQQSPARSLGIKNNGHRLSVCSLL